MSDENEGRRDVREEGPRHRAEGGVSVGASSKRSPAQGSPPDALWDETQTAAFLGLRRSTLQRWRWAGKGPRYLKVGGAVRYRLSDLSEFLEGAVRETNTGEESQ